jgi:hypothetical protein
MSQTSVGNLAVELGINDAQLRAGLAQAVVQAQQAGQKMANSVSKGASTATGGRSNAMGFLNLSRAIDDVQYGFQGVINNIEGIVSGFGGSAGIAGAATIAGVAMIALVPRVAELVAMKDPIRELADTLKGIQGSGVAGTFVGIAQEARAAQAAFEAASTQLSKMKTTSVEMVGFAFEGAMSDPNSGLEVRNDPKEIFRRQVQVNDLAQGAALSAFEASQARSRVAAAGLAKYELTTDQKDQTKINQQIFQAALDKMGGGQMLADALKGKNLGNAGLFGAFKEGDIQATDEAVRLLGLQAERAKVLADEFDRATGAAAELAKIENDRVSKERRVVNRQFGEYEQAVGRQDNLFGRMSSIELQRNRSEILGSAADVFGRNINAGQEDPQLKELREIKEEIRNLQPITGLG